MSKVTKNGWIGIGVVVAVLVIGLALFGTYQGNISKGNKLETGQLNPAYQAAQTSLSNCLDKSTVAANVTQAQAAQFRAALTDALKSRYEGREPNPGQMFGMVVENYPDMAPLADQFSKAFNVMIGCRDDFTNAQDYLQAQLAAYDAWRTGSFMVRTFGGGNFPSNNLTAKVGRETLHGQAAEDQMKNLVLKPEARKAFETGDMPGQELFPTTAPGK